MEQVEEQMRKAMRNEMASRRMLESMLAHPDTPESEKLARDLIALLQTGHGPECETNAKACIEMTERQMLGVCLAAAYMTRLVGDANVVGRVICLFCQSTEQVIAEDEAKKGHVDLARAPPQGAA